MNTGGLGGLLWFLALGAFFYFMMRMGGCGGGSHDSRSEDHARQSGAVKGRLKDPVCGMEVEAAKAKTSVYDGRTFYFCSNDCREKFEADPASYAGKGRSSGGC